MVVVMAPALDENLGFEEGVEDLAIEKLIAQFAVEAFIVAILPRASGLDKESFDPDPGEPGLDGLGRELAAVVRTNVVGRPTLSEQLCQTMQDVVGPETPGHFDRQAFPGEFVDDGEHAELAPVPRPVLDEIIGPDVPGPGRPQP